EGDAALAAEVVGRISPVLEDRHDVPARPADLLVMLAQLDELLAAERSAEVAHEGHDQRPVAPALGERHVALAGLDVEVRELVAFLEHRCHLMTPRARPSSALGSCGDNFAGDVAAELRDRAPLL